MIPQDSIKPAQPLFKPSGLGMRHVLTFLGFWGFSMSYALRFNLSLAIVAMVKRNKSEEVGENSTSGFSNSTSTCPSSHPHPTHSFSAPSDGEFSWNEVEQGIILGSFFWGYMLTQLPGGLAAQRFGGKWTLGLGLFVAAIFGILTPLMARAHVGLLIAARVIQGLGEGVTTPAMHMLLSAWIPPEERGSLASITYSGTSFGTAATMILGGYLIEWNVFGGWPSVFYITGGITLVWFGMWCVLVYDTPAEHPRIKGDELYYIQRSIGEQVSKVVQAGFGWLICNFVALPYIQEKPATPWGKIAKSLPVWVIIIAHTGHTWGLYTLLTELPTYMKTVLNFDIKQNSWMSALPYGLMCIVGFVIPGIADIFIKRKILSTLNVRKVCQVIAHVGGAIALIGASYSGCNTTLTVILLTISGGVQGSAFAGFGVNHIDISSNHAGVLMGITNTVANISGFLGPYVAGVLINGNPTLARWQIVFFIAAAVYVLDTVVFLMFATADEQDWNREGGRRTVCPEESTTIRESDSTNLLQSGLDTSGVIF